MINLASLSSVLETSGQFVQQSQATIGSLQQQSAAIGPPLADQIWVLAGLRKGARNNKHSVVLSSDTKKAPEVLQLRLDKLLAAQEAPFVFKITNGSG